MRCPGPLITQAQARPSWDRGTFHETPSVPRDTGRAVIALGGGRGTGLGSHGTERGPPSGAPRWRGGRPCEWDSGRHLQSRSHVAVCPLAGLVLRDRVGVVPWARLPAQATPRAAQVWKNRATETPNPNSVRRTQCGRRTGPLPGKGDRLRLRGTWPRETDAPVTVARVSGPRKSQRGRVRSGGA